jgi:TRAP-type uncharacterized transport system substrate-binding protein
MSYDRRWAALQHQPTHCACALPLAGVRCSYWRFDRRNQPDELCYAVVKAVIENFADFRRLHPALSTLEIKDMVPSGSVIPIHPGALNYYREAGLVH